MALLIMALRRSELTHSINSLEYQIMKLSRERRKYTSLANALGDGKITASEIACLNSDILPCVFDSEKGAMSVPVYNVIAGMAEDKCYEYELACNTNPYYQSQNINIRTPEGDLDPEFFNACFEKALKEYVEQELEPKFKEIEEDFEERKLELETERDMEKAELDAINNAISEEISSSAIKL